MEIQSNDRYSDMGMLQPRTSPAVHKKLMIPILCLPCRPWGTEARLAGGAPQREGRLRRCSRRGSSRSTMLALRHRAGHLGPRRRPERCTVCYGTGIQRKEKIFKLKRRLTQREGMSLHTLHRKAKSKRHSNRNDEQKKCGKLHAVSRTEKTYKILKVGEVVRPYQPLSIHVAKLATATAQITAHVADAVAAPRPSANDVPRLKRSQAQLSSIGMKMTPTNGQPVPNTHSMATKIWAYKLPLREDRGTCLGFDRGLHVTRHTTSKFATTSQ